MEAVSLIGSILKQMSGSPIQVVQVLLRMLWDQVLPFLVWGLLQGVQLHQQGMSLILLQIYIKPEEAGTKQLLKVPKEILVMQFGIPRSQLLIFSALNQLLKDLNGHQIKRWHRKSKGGLPMKLEKGKGSGLCYEKRECQTQILINILQLKLLIL